MARIKLTKNNLEQRHKSRMAMLSKEIQSIAFKKQQTTKAFPKGDEVEVASQEYGFIGSYYTATIVNTVGAYHYRIKYKTLLTDDESAPLEEVASVAEVRPVPPHQPETMSETGFRLYDMVDVFANDGWWFGFISGKIGEEYCVYFPTTEDNIAYPPDVLRFHQEWSDGKWISLCGNHRRQKASHVMSISLTLSEGKPFVVMQIPQQVVATKDSTEVTKMKTLGAFASATLGAFASAM